jgi:hypothetical protein
MKISSTNSTLRLAALALCSLLVMTFLSGCGGSDPVDAIIKEQKALAEEMKGALTDPTKALAFAPKQAEIAKKIAALTPEQKKAYEERIKKEMGDAFKNLIPDK